MKDIQQFHASISGIVQGVGYRHFVLQRAQMVPMSGWVRNTYDGRVEVVAQGERRDLDALLEWLGQGPPRSVVEMVEVTWQPPDPQLPAGFKVRF